TGGQLHPVIGEPHRLDIVLEGLPSPAGIMPQPGAGVRLGRLPRRVRVGLPGEGARRDFAPAQIAVIGGVSGLAVVAPPPAREAHGARLPSDRLLTVDCGQRGQTLWTGTHVID